MVESQTSKLLVASSILVSRSIENQAKFANPAVAPASIGWLSRALGELRTRSLA